MLTNLCRGLDGSVSPVRTDFLFKFLVIGNAGVGKSCLLHQFIEQKCKSSNGLPPQKEGVPNGGPRGLGDDGPFFTLVVVHPFPVIGLLDPYMACVLVFWHQHTV